MSKRIHFLSKLCLLPLEASPVAFAYINGGFDCLFANKAFYNLFDITEDEKISFESETSEINLVPLMPRPFYFLNSAMSDLENALIKAKNERSYQFNWFFLSREKKSIYVEISLQHVVHEGEDIYACYINENDDHEHTVRRAEHSITQYRNFIESMPLFAHVWDENLNLLDCGDEVMKLFNLNDKESYLKNFLKFSPKFQLNGVRSEDLVVEKLKEALSVGKISFPWTHINPKTMENIPCEVTLVRSMDKGHVYVYGYMTDRRQYYRDQAEINKAYEMFQLMRDIMPICSFLFSPDYKMIDCNKEIERVFKTTKADYLENYIQFIPKLQPDGVPSFEKGKKLYDRALKYGHARFEWVFLDKEGNEIPTDLTLHRVQYRGQEMYAAFAIDLRESKAFNKKIQEHNERNEQVLNSLPIGTVYWDENHEIVECNKAMLKLFKVESLEEYKTNFDKFTLKEQIGAHKAVDDLLNVQKQRTQDDTKTVKNLLEEGTQKFDYERLLIAEAFRCGYKRIEYERLDNEGNPLFVDVTAVRLEQDGKPFVAMYTVDLTDARLNELRTLEASERMQVMFDAFPMSAKLWNKDLQILDCNMAAIKILGYTSKEEYLNYANTLKPEALPKGREHYQKYFVMLEQALQTGFARFEWVTKDKLNREIPVEVSCFRAKYQGELSVISYLRDLRDQKKMLIKMEEERERVQVMFDAFPMSAKLWDRDLHILDCNLEAIRTLGYDTKEEYIRYANRLEPENLPRYRQYYKVFFEKVAETFETGYTQFQWMTKDKNGHDIPVEVTCIRVIHNADERVISYLRDLRAEKKMLKDLQEATERMQIMFNTFPMGANFWNKDLQIIDCNQEVVKLSGFSTKTDYLKYVASFTKNKFSRINNYDDKIFEVVAKAFETGYEQIEWITTHKDGYQIPVERTFIREKNENGEEVVVGYMRDLREQKKMMQEIIDIQENYRQVKELAERNANIKSEFLAHMSHEIRTPMNGVIGLVHLLLESNLVGQQKDYAQKALSSANHLLKVVNDILDLSSFEKGKLKMEKAFFTLDEVCQDVTDLYKPRAEKKGLSYTITLDEKSKGELFGDAFRLKQVLFNLVSNALKFTEKGNINIDISCTREKNKQKTLLFLVRDTGIGLTEDQLSKLFSPFSQAESFITRKYGGTDLGLMIAKQIIEAMQGEIWVESEYGNSSTFAFTVVCDLDQEALPIVEDRAIKVILEKSEAATTFAEAKRVLLVEDNKINQLIAKELLKKHGYAIALAENGQEALDMLDKENFDIVLMDIQMPVMDGLTATKEIRKQSKYNKIPIIAVSAHTMEGDKEVCLESGMNAHVRKPISPPELFHAMETCLTAAL